MIHFPILPLARANRQADRLAPSTAALSGGRKQPAELESVRQPGQR